MKLNRLQFTSQVHRSTGPRLTCAIAFILALTVNLPRASAVFFRFSTTATLSNYGAAVPGNNGTSSVSLTTPVGQTVFTLNGEPSSGDNVDGSGDGSDIVFANIGVGLSSTTAAETVSFDYSLHLSISDYGTVASGGSALDTKMFNVNGTLVEKLGFGDKVNLVSNTFTSPSSIIQFVNGEQYTVSVYRFIPPGANNLGAFGVHVQVTEVVAPEPRTFTLLGSGILTLAIPVYRRWRRKA